jgi:hypothetical protein
VVVGPREGIAQLVADGGVQGKSGHGFSLF